MSYQKITEEGEEGLSQSSFKDDLDSPSSRKKISAIVSLVFIGSLVALLLISGNQRGSVYASTSNLVSASQLGSGDTSDGYCYKGSKVRGAGTVPKGLYFDSHLPVSSHYLSATPLTTPLTIRTCTYKAASQIMSIKLVSATKCVIQVILAL